MVTKQEGSTISDYLQLIKVIIDDLALIGHSLCDEEVVIHTLNGLDTDYKELAAAIRARDSSISFEDLYDKLTDYEMSLKRADKLPGSTVTAQVSHKSKRKNARYSPNITQGLATTPLDSVSSMQHPSYPPSHPFSQSGDSSHHPSWRPALPSHQRRVVCQLCDKVGHSAKVCRSRLRLPTPSHWPQANLLTTPTPSQSNWIVDSGASHHITADLQNLSLHNPYGGDEDIIIGDGKGLPITHTGFTTLNSDSNTFTLDDVLCAPHIKRNLISVSQFCKHNNTSIEFFPDSFLVKDLSTGASLVQGQSKDNVYEWPSLPQIKQPTAYSSVAASIDVWHRRLGHPSLPIQNKLLSRYSLSIPTNNRFYL